MSPSRMSQDPTLAIDFEENESERSGLHDTMAVFELNEINVRAVEADAMLIGTTRTCRERFRLKPGQSMIGRDHHATINIQDSGISRQHARLELTASELRVKDLGSSNGTFVNGHRIRDDTVLRDGDVVVFGKDTRFLVAIKQREAKPAKSPQPNQERAETGKPKARPVAPLVSGTTDLERKITILQRERRQLAILFQLAVRYLNKGPDDDPVSVLFDVLDRIVVFDAAFIAIPDGVGYRFEPHPTGKALSPAECAKLVEECDAEAARALDDVQDAMTLSGLQVGSRALVPLADGGCLAFLCQSPRVYTPQIDFLSLLGTLHSSAIG